MNTDDASEHPPVVSPSDLGEIESSDQSTSVLTEIASSIIDMGSSLFTRISRRLAYVSSEPCKLVFVVRTDVGMGKGKMCAQCGHAAVEAYKAASASEDGREILKAWEEFGQTKVALKGNSEAELLQLRSEAVKHDLLATIIHDAGHTQVEAGTATVLAIGPGPVSLVDKVTRQLKLL
jgi:peptidyl-tRNA hydrolase, PTH2 family